MLITTVDLRDDAALAACHTLELASIAHDRPAGLPRTLAELVHQLRTTSPLESATMYAATDDGEVVGTAQLLLSLQDNLHLADVMVHVHPLRRRAGLGRALYDVAVGAATDAGRSTVLAEVETSLAPTQPGMAFATALGYEDAHGEERLTLALPATVAHLRTSLPGVRLVTWSGPCPDEHVTAYCGLRNQMETDVPLGEVAWTPLVFDEERLRRTEDDLLATRDMVYAIAFVDGEPAGYSGVSMDRDDVEVHQEDTLVMPSYRRRGIATQLKLSTLDVVQRDHPERRTLHTWTDPENTAMYDLNQRFGFRTVERVHEMQRELS